LQHNATEITNKTSVEGLYFDFNDGLRIQVPNEKFKIFLEDYDKGLIITSTVASGTTLAYKKAFFVNYRLAIYKDDKLIFEHIYNAKSKNILIRFAKSATWEVVAWIPYVEEFRKKHQCQLFCKIPERFVPVLKQSYPKITFVDTNTVPDNLYATYDMVCATPNTTECSQYGLENLHPADWRLVGLQRYGAYILGVEPVERRPRILSNKSSALREKYVCISSQAAAQCQYWNTPNGWLELIEYLKKCGYRVLCIDRYALTVNGWHGNSIPYGSEDFTGERSVQEIIDLLSQADFFVGLSNELAWLAWSLGKPVVLLAGHTAPNTEFYTPYRIENFLICNSCYNDRRIERKNFKDFSACPRYNGTDQEYTCTRFISPTYAKNIIDRLIQNL